MAYVRQDDEDPQNQQAAPTLAPGASSGSAGGMVGGTQPSVQPSAPVQTPQQKQGSGGFTNLSNWLDAGKGRDKQISTTGSGLLSTERKTFDTAATPLRDATFTADTTDDAGISNLLNTETGYNNNQANSAPAMQRLQNMVTQDYTGPMNVDWDPSKRAGLRSLDNLSATSTTGTELVGDAQYTAGSKRLDNSLFGADSASQDAIGANKKNTGDFLVAATGEVKTLGDKTTGFQTSAKDARELASGQLGREADRIYADITTRVDHANAVDQQTQNRANDGTAVPFRTVRSVIEGSGANENNIVSRQESAQLRELGKLIGARQVERTGEYRPWEVNDVMTPDPIQDAVDSRLSGEEVDASGTAKQDSYSLEMDRRDPARVRREVVAEEAMKAYGRAEAADGTIGLQDPDTGQVYSMSEIMSGEYDWDPNTGRLVKRKPPPPAYKWDYTTGRMVKIGGLV